EAGVRFVRSRVHLVQPLEDGGLRLEYTEEQGRPRSEDFDLVVLSVGLEVAPQVVELAGRLGIALDEDNFADTSPFAPVLTPRSGIFVAGAFQEPHNIHFSIMGANAAACEAAACLASARGTLVRRKTYPPERDVRSEKPRLGVFVCNCGTNIGGVVNVPEVVEYVRTLPGVVHAEDNLFTCSQDTQQKIKEVIERENLNRVVVAACTPRTHEEVFRETLRGAGLNKYLFEMANIRNHCSWVHQNDRPGATAKAKDLVRMAVAKAGRILPLAQPTIPVDNGALVIGGGVAGLTAALSLADQGFPVHLVEKTDRLGGNALRLLTTWRGGDVRTYVRETIARARRHPLVEIHTRAEIKSSAGFVGNFETTVARDGAEVILRHGAVILAVGAEEYKPREYGYGRDDRILTHLEMDDALKQGDPRIARARRVIFIQCVGSREPERPYCSKICCTHTMKSALHLKEINPGLEVFVLYRDIRTYGQRERLYLEARRRGVMFIRFEPESRPRVETGDRLTVWVKDQALGRNLVLAPDLIVLAAAIVARDNDALARLFRLPRNEDGFFTEAHAKLRPVEFAADGFFLAGLAQYPKSIRESISQAQAAASRAAVLLSKKELTVEGVVSQVDEKRCRGCGECEQVCPYGAMTLVERDGGARKASVREAMCKGCGSCAAACPTGAASLRHFDDWQVLAPVRAALLG
ncbi:MAG: 4Fe-4S binding protein, partial [Thermodesulfobacteriota bacterium]